ncbi:hypothetical protein AC578_10079 [Pseudocercospora eumusae]|uniref:Uncharacterized protein n=1 Tax=Pseudocercospora eumusae TaxID=321146 RepID=A0A139H868_9PEZI|nr:hypothetical protein AC578_10079 [Pseudocercospora eumusae]
MLRYARFRTIRTSLETQNLVKLLPIAKEVWRNSLITTLLLVHAFSQNVSNVAPTRRTHIRQHEKQHILSSPHWATYSRPLAIRHGVLGRYGFFKPANDPGLGLNTASAEDPLKGPIEKETNGSWVEDDRPVAPDQFDPKWETTTEEIWAYCSYYIGNNGLTLFNFAPLAA